MLKYTKSTKWWWWKSKKALVRQNFETKRFYVFILTLIYLHFLWSLGTSYLWTDYIEGALKKKLVTLYNRSSFILHPVLNVCVFVCVCCVDPDIWSGGSMQDGRRLDEWYRHGPSSTENVSFHSQVWFIRKYIICYQLHFCLCKVNWALLGHTRMYCKQNCQ